ncbi:SHOCT domain-containing protein [Desulfopila sp. IMCC35006]|nr:SHOCT domain-containing protein [Desulfopila sp. IMCC35006]
MNGFPQGSGHMMGYGGGMYMWLFWIFIVGVIAYFVLDRIKHNQNAQDSSGESPTEILKKRYARGEITKEEFDRIKKELEN